MDENNGNKWFLYVSVLSVNLMSFSANAAYSWTSPFLPKLNGHVDPESNPLPNTITLMEESWITSLISVGAICGPVCTGKISEKIGKKMTLLLFSIPVFLSNVILIFANRVYHFYLSRFLVGLGIGCVFCIIPSYVAEITNVSDRGKTGVLITLVNSLSHLSVVLIGPYVSIKTFAYLSLIPSVLFFVIVIPFVPESPCFYVSRNRLEDAERSLRTLRRRSNVKLELLEIIEGVTKTEARGSFKDIIHSRVVLKGLFITVGLMLCQQVNGCQPINAYLQKIFRFTGGFLPNEISVIVVGVAQLFTTLLVVGLIDKMGRKKLLMISFFGLLLSLVSLAVYFLLQERGFGVEDVSWIPVIGSSLFMMFFKFGVGPVPWTIVAEVFPSNLKVHLSAVVTFAMVVFGFVVTFMFPIMLDNLGMAWTFWIFALCTVGSLLFIWLFVPEIKGMSFVQIQKLLQK